MIDLHTHTLVSDGLLIPAELARRAEVAGYRAIAFTDHVDHSNVEQAVPALVEAARALNGELDVLVIPGAEITHVPPALIGELVKRCRELGAALVVVHGESPVEPVAEGTNRAGIEAGADILAHPGFIRPEDAALAATKGVALEITARKGHSLTNGYVAKTALEAGATLVINTDMHAPSDMITREFASAVLMGAGLGEKEIEEAFMASEALVKKATGG